MTRKQEKQKQQMLTSFRFNSYFEWTSSDGVGSLAQSLTQPVMQTSRVGATLIKFDSSFSTVKRASMSCSQRGFRLDRSITYDIFYIRQILEKTMRVQWKRTPVIYRFREGL